MLSYANDGLLTFDEIKTIIDEGRFSFFMRNKEQAEFAPSGMTFTSEMYKFIYTLRDMAILCTSLEVSTFITDVAHRMSHNMNRDSHLAITDEEMEYVIRFVKKARPEYEKCVYVNLKELESGDSQ